MATRLAVALLAHAHQPVGADDRAVAAAVTSRYAPLLAALRELPDVHLGWRCPGPLREWCARREPGYRDALRAAVASGQVELVGGGFGEAILAWIPERDRRGQLLADRRALEGEFATRVRGAWLPASVYEPHLIPTFARAAVEWVAIPERHVARGGGATTDASAWIEVDGLSVRALVLSERLGAALATGRIEAVRGALDAARAAGARVVAAALDLDAPDPPGGAHDPAGLVRALAALPGLTLCTPAEALERYAPAAVLHPPAGADAALEAAALPDGRGGDGSGAAWRSLSDRGPEVAGLLAAMREASERVQALPAGHPAALEAGAHLYRGQEHTAYHAGPRGGLAWPHRRATANRHLLAASRLAGEVVGEPALTFRQWDWNGDGRPEIRLATPLLGTVLVPHRGGHCATLEARRQDADLGLATTRRGPGPGLFAAETADGHVREGAVDHLFAPGFAADALAAGRVPDEGDFASGVYVARVSQSPDEARVVLARAGTWRRGRARRAVRLEKEVRLAASGDTLTLTYRLAADGPGRDDAWLAVEWNVGLLSATGPDRGWRAPDGARLGEPSARLDLRDVAGVDAVDEARRVACLFRADRPVRVLTYPVASVPGDGGAPVYQASALVLAVPVVLAKGERTQVEFAVRVSTP